ncbi:MAG TPA: hypothetical protein VGG64_05860 [Pirellulales bacterium]
MNQARTWTDIQYEQVLDNIAMFVNNPGSMPYFAGVGGGVSDIKDYGSVGASSNWAFPFNTFSYFNQAVGLNASRQRNENWSLAPVYQAPKLADMRFMYASLVTGSCQDERHAEYLHSAYHIDPSVYMTPCWWGAGKLRNVPHSASYVGHYRGVYVWVMPEHVAELTNLSLAILKVAATVPNTSFEAGEGTIEEGSPQYENWFNPLLNQVMTRH